MAEKENKLLIIDDSEIDRGVLRSILGEEFSIIEAENGSDGLDQIRNGSGVLDAILLDVSMPVMDGFGMLEQMKKYKMEDIPVYLITAEATRQNVANAAQYHVSGFIKKPFEREDILWRLEAKMGMLGYGSLSEEDIQETEKYIADLDNVYRRFLKNFGQDSGHYERMSDLMEILLKQYLGTRGQTSEEEKIQIGMISRAAFFCDIGNMLLPNNFKFKASKQDEMSNDIYGHTRSGASIVRLNYSKHCEYFVQVCADMCAHHHERYDGNGFPNKLVGKNNTIFTQMCKLADEFDNLFYRYREHNDLQFEFVRGMLARDQGSVRPEVMGLLAGCKQDIDRYYGKMEPYN
ncbi:MAG: response regulator [Lachnospiraceae bacterium]|nr:response regulator [Lachnospiraceae bacterium]